MNSIGSSSGKHKPGSSAGGRKGSSAGGEKRKPRSSAGGRKGSSAGGEKRKRAESATEGSSSTAERSHVKVHHRTGVTCSFLCGSTSESKDPFGVADKIRWCRPRNDDGTVNEGENCWPCERVYCTQIKHRKSRKDQIAEMGEDKAVHTQFQADRTTFMSRKRSGEKNVRDPDAKRRRIPSGTLIPYFDIC
jgi:hypothetical protein